MYEYISGKLASITPANAVVDCGGVGYLLEITLSTYSAIQEKAEVKLWVHESIREDAHQLYGFYEVKEREMFRMLLSVNGVGASIARMILSSLSVSELSDAIASDNAKMLQRVKGVGAKTAQRIVLELKDKVGEAGLSAGLAVQVPSVLSRSKEEALSALVMLGFPKPTADKVLQSLDGSMTVESLIKEALKKL